MNALIHKLQASGRERREAVLYRSGSVDSMERGEQ
jgi:hypothetical protein